MWTGRRSQPEAHGRNAVFYGEKAIDRSPAAPAPRRGWPSSTAAGSSRSATPSCTRASSAALFEGRVEGATELGGQTAIVPSVAGWARITGHNTIFVDERDPYRRGFQVV